MKNQQHHQDCPFCQWVKEHPSYLIEKNNPSYLSLANISPDSEGHVLIITKEPRTNITELTKEEWANLLPLLKSTTNKITNTFYPQGFNIYSNAGAEGGARQAVFHFHLHVVPEREGNRGVGYLRKPWFIPSVEKYQEIEKALQVEQGIVKDNEKIIAKLVEREQASDYGHLVITSKEFNSHDLNQIDIKTWTQMGELLRESIERIEQGLNPSSLRTCIFLGKIGGLNQANNSQFQIHLIPRYKSQGHAAKEAIPIPPEVLEVAESLREAESEIVEKKRKVEQLESQVEIPPKIK